MTKYAPMKYKIISFWYFFKVKQRDAKVECVTSKEWKKYTACKAYTKYKLRFCYNVIKGFNSKIMALRIFCSEKKTSFRQKYR